MSLRSSKEMARYCALDHKHNAQERPAWNAPEVAAAMGLTQDGLRKNILFWVSHGVLQETQTPSGMVSAPLLRHYACSVPRNFGISALFILPGR